MSARVAVVIPAFNEDPSRVLLSALSAIAAGAAEVLVVDDGSDLPLAPIANTNSIRLDANRGIGAALNVGIRQATPGWICVLGAGDTMDANKIAAQFGTVGASFHDYRNATTGETVIAKPNWSRRIFYDNQFCGSTIMVAREVLLELNGYNEDLRWCQDWDLAIRVHAAVGWEHVPHVLGSISGTPRHSVVSGERERMRNRCRAMVNMTARELERLD